MKKILFYINSISRGGAERVLCNLANSFSNRGYDVIVATSLNSDKEYELDSKIQRSILLNRRIKGFFVRNIKLISKLKLLIKAERPDVVVSFMKEANFRTVLACRKTKTKCIVSIRNDPHEEYKSLINKLLANSLYSKASGIVFQTPDAKAFFRSNVQSRSRIIYNPVNKFFLLDSIENGKDNIVTIGRVVKQKNQELLIRAFASVSNQISSNLVIVGDGKLKSKLIKLTNKLNISNRVDFVGTTNDVLSILKTSRIFVLTSNYEGIPNSLMEALALGLPCIATDCPCGGPRLLIEDGVSGLLIPVKDKNKLASSMLYLLNNQSYANEMGKKAKEFLNSNFNPDLIFEEWEKYVLEVSNNEIV